MRTSVRFLLGPPETRLLVEKEQVKLNTVHRTDSQSSRLQYSAAATCSSGMMSTVCLSCRAAGEAQSRRRREGTLKDKLYLNAAEL